MSPSQRMLIIALRKRGNGATFFQRQMREPFSLGLDEIFIILLFKGRRFKNALRTDKPIELMELVWQSGSLMGIYYGIHLFHMYEDKNTVLGEVLKNKRCRSGKDMNY